MPEEVYNQIREFEIKIKKIEMTWVFPFISNICCCSYQENI